MKTTKTNAGLKVKASIKAGGLHLNHNRVGLKVQADIKAGGFDPPTTTAGLKVQAGIKAGGLHLNHNRAGLKVQGWHQGRRGFLPAQPQRAPLLCPSPPDSARSCPARSVVGLDVSLLSLYLCKPGVAFARPRSARYARPAAIALSIPTSARASAKLVSARRDGSGSCCSRIRATPAPAASMRIADLPSRDESSSPMPVSANPRFRLSGSKFRSQIRVSLLE